MSTERIRILGIDPGLRNMGWGIIEIQGQNLSFIACGSIHSDAACSLADRLCQLYEGLAQIISSFHPQEAAVEETFVNSDPQSALKLGQARGIALLAPALAKITVAGYAANLVKKTVSGTGHADKEQMARMIKILLPKSAASSPDAADALAVAITHAWHRNIPKG